LFTSNLIESNADLMHACKRQIAIEFAKSDIQFAPTHFKVMQIIDRSSPCTGQDVASVLQRDNAQITRLLKELESKGVISRQQNPLDKRSQILSVTEEGEAVLKKMRAAAGRVKKRLIEGVSADDQLRFLELLHQMKLNLEP